MGIGSNGEQESSRNAAFGPGMDLVKKYEEEYLYWFARIPGFGVVTIRRIWEMVRSLERTYYIEGMELGELGILQSKEKCRTYDRWREWFFDIVREYNCLQEKGICLMAPLDREYPKRFLHIYDYPMRLYVRGELPGERYPIAATIGVRNCSKYGRRAAGFMGKELARASVQIANGLALDIDGAGHRDALSGKGRAYEVPGYSVNIYYPRSNYYPYEAIPFQRGTFPEFGPDEEPVTGNFSARNCIISGLSDVILIMGAREKSGSLITANLGLEQGKGIFALLGRVTDDLSARCNKLIRSGAGILTNPEDVLNYMDISHEKKCINHGKDQKGPAKTEKIVYSCLDSESRHLEQIIVQTGPSAGRCMSAPLELGLEGFAVRTSGQDYTKTIT